MNFEEMERIVAGMLQVQSALQQSQLQLASNVEAAIAEQNRRTTSLEATAQTILLAIDQLRLRQEEARDQQTVTQAHIDALTTGIDELADNQRQIQEQMAVQQGQIRILLERLIGPSPNDS
jgi:chromosome segregation ATPase